ncbi:MAG: stage II sporulation protein M [Armatimonadota bacterium]
MAADYPEWQRLREILARIKAEGFDRLTAEEIIEFGKWYRRAAVELSFHRSRGADAPRVAFLNDLVGQCYAYVYTAPRRPWPSLLRFLTADFPRTFRKQGIFMLIAALLLLVPGIISFAITWHDKTLAAQVLPPDFMDAIPQIVERHHKPKDWLPAFERLDAFSLIATNNIRISILAFAGGMTGGLVTIPLLITNGIMLGVITAGVGMDSMKTAVNFWAFVAPHGVIELSAIYIAGGAGLVLAYALLVPGVYPRRIALVRAGKEALILILGVALMLAIAAIVEAFFSPLNIKEFYKFYVAGFLCILLYGYLLIAGRRTKEEEEKAPQEKLMTPLPPV